MIRKDEKYPVSFIFDNIEIIPSMPKVRKNMDGDQIYMGSIRYKVFEKNCTCVVCGLEGTYFVKEKHIHANPYHFNLYGVNEFGHEILMTKDHIIPKSQGGSNHLSNYQTMCTKCNHTKGSSK
jgi:5-methylcytosine-specific restriction endonuclease McrA